MTVYELQIAEVGSLAKERWMISAKSIEDALRKGVSKKNRNKELRENWEIVAIERIGELI